MGLKTAGVGHFQIPTAPAAGVSVVSGAANNLTATAIQLSASVSAQYITGVHVETSAALAATYILVQLCVGAGGAETSIGQYLVPLSTGSTVALGYRQIYPPIPMAAGQRLSVKTADSVGSKTYLVTAECILQSNVVDDAIAVTTVTNLTNAPTTGDFTAAMKTSLSAATPTVTLANGAHGGAAAAITLGGAAGLTCTHIGNQTGNVSGSVGSVIGAVGSVTGAVGSVTGAVGSVTGAVGSVTAGVTLANGTHGGAAATLTLGGAGGLTATHTGNTTGSVGSVTGAVGSVTGLTATDVGAIKTQTDKFAFTVANQVDCNVIDWKGLAAPAMTGDAFARIGVAGAGLTALGDTRIANLDTTVSSRLATTGYTVPPTAAAIASATMDEVLTGATHNIPASAGRRLRAIGAAIAGTVVDAAATTTSFKTSLTGADTFYDDQLVMFTSGALAGQVKAINAYLQTNGRITLDAIDPLVAAPANGDAFDILPQHVHPTSQIAEVVRMEMDANSSKLANLDATISSIPTAAESAAELLATAVDGTTTVAESVRLANATLGGKASGLDGTTAVYRDLADTKDRITATVDANGNRTAVVRNLT